MSAWEPSLIASPQSPTLRSILMPGVSLGTRNIDMPWYALTSGSVTAITMRNDAVFAFDEKYFQPLMTHSSPSLSRAALEQRGVGAGVRLGHRVAREALAVEQRLEVLLLLLVGAVVGDDLGVAGVGRLAPEHDRRPLRPAEDLVEQRELELAVALAAELGAEVGRPQALAPDLLLEGVDDRPTLAASAGGTAGAGTRGRAARTPPARSCRPSPASPGTRDRSRSPTPWWLPLLCRSRLVRTRF